MVGHAVVIDHNPAGFGDTALHVGAVDPGDRLEQLGLLDRSIQVHGLLDRGIEAGEQHRLDDQEGQRVGAGMVVGVGPGSEQRLLEAGDVGIDPGAGRPLA